jgi:GNAT superfamily N-acetyltransferase
VPTRRWFDPLAFRTAKSKDFAFCQRLYFDESQWLIEKLGLDEARQVESFARGWAAAEVRIIMVAGCDVGWLQVAPNNDAVFLKQLYLDRRFHNRGVGTGVMQFVIDEAAHAGHAVILGVAKINPARRLYERLGFHVTHEDQHKIYMRRDSDLPAM